MPSWVRKLLKYPSMQKAINNLAERSANMAGRFLYKPHVAWWNDRAWLAPYEKYVLETRILDRRFTLIEFAKAARTLPGSTAEAGVFTGISSALICKALEGTYAPDESHLGFDSFEGLPEPAASDMRPDPSAANNHALRSIYEKNWQRGDLRSPMEVAQECVSDFPFCRLVRGWIPECFAEAAGRRFRFVHIDVDLETPTRESLEFFYRRLNTGGLILFDDYALLSCPGARRAVQEFFRDKPEPVIELVTGQAVVIKK